MEITTELPRRLYKSRRNRIIDGVCGGIAEYFDVDPTLVRLLWVLVTLLGGSGFILYIVAMIVMPVNPDQIAQPAVTSPGTPGNGGDRKRFFGILLILVGAFVLMINLGWVSEWGWWSLSGKVMVPVLIILLGVFFIYMQTRKRIPPPIPQTEGIPTEPASTSSQQPPTAPRELRRSATDKKLFGVCGGLAKYFNVDPTIIRFLFVFVVLASFGWGVLLYIILGLIMPEEKPVPTA